MSEERRELKGGYFIYCQFCNHDGNCELKHNELLGLPANEKIHRRFGVNAAFEHENLSCASSAFQKNKVIGTCTGRIIETESLYFPLICSKCETVISSLTLQHMSGTCCAKFEPNEYYQKCIGNMEQIAKEKGITLDEVDFSYYPEPDEAYIAVMER